MSPRIPITPHLFKSDGNISADLRLGGDGSAQCAGGNGTATPAQVVAWLRNTADDIEAVAAEMLANSVVKIEPDTRVHVIISGLVNPALDFAHNELKTMRRNIIIVHSSRTMERLRGVNFDNVLLHVIDSHVLQAVRPELSAWAAIGGLEIDDLIKRGNMYRDTVKADKVNAFVNAVNKADRG